MKSSISIRDTGSLFNELSGGNFSKDNPLSTVLTRELKSLGIDTSKVTSIMKAKSLIAEAQLQENESLNDVEDIQDTVQISQMAQNALKSDNLYSYVS